MAEIPPIAIRVYLETGQVAPAVAQVQGEIEKIGTTAETTSEKTKTLGNAFGGLKDAVKGFVALEAIQFLVESGKAAADNNKSFAEMSRTMANAEGASKAQTDAVDKQISALADLGAMTTAQVRPSFDILERSTKNSTTALQLSKVAMDVSAGTGKDLTAVTQAMAKAYEGNTGALAKLVPSVKGAKDPLKALQDQFAGAAKTAADQDPYKRMGVMFEEMKVTLGKALMPVFETFAKVLKDLSPLITIVSKVFGELATALMPIIEKVFAKLQPYWEQLGKVFSHFIEKLVPPLAQLFEKVLLPALSFVIDFVEKYVLPIFERFADYLGNVLPNVINVFVGAFKVVGNVLKPIWDFVIKPILDGLMTLMGIDPNKFASSATSAMPSTDYTAGTFAGGTGAGGAGAGGSAGGASASKKAATDLATAKQVLADAKAGVKDAQKAYTQAVYDAYTSYNDKVKATTEQRDNDIRKLEEAHANNLLSIQKDYSNRLQGIVQQSMDLLRGAFKSAASVDVGSMLAANLSASDISSVVATQMKGGIQTAVSYWGSPSAGSGISGLISSLSDKLDASKKLIDNSAALAGAGYSQNFIQQIVSQGSTMGNKMADAILAATPEQQKQLQDLFAANEQTANNGMDDVAKAIYDKSGLATDELKKLYSQTQSDLTQALADEQKQYVDQQKAINETFATAMKDAHKTLVDALNGAGDALNNSLDKVSATMTSKLSKVKGAVSSVASSISSTKSLIDGSRVETSTPIVPGAGFAVAQNQGTAGTSGADVTQNFYNIDTSVTTDADPNAIAMGIANAIKFGSPIRVA